MPYTLINFNIPNHLKKNFDHLVRFKNVSRTSILNTMIEEFCRKEFKLIEMDGRLNDLISHIETNNIKSVKEPRYSTWEDSYDDPLDINFSQEIDPLYDDGIRL